MFSRWNPLQFLLVKQQRLLGRQAMRSHFCEETTGAQKRCGKSPGKNQPQNLLQPVGALDTHSVTQHSWVILDFMQLKYWFFVALSATWKLCHLPGCWHTPQSHTANQELMFAWLPLWAPAILNTERKYSSGSQLVPGFLLCWAADTWHPVGIINTTHGYGSRQKKSGFCLISTCHENR